MDRETESRRGSPAVAAGYAAGRTDEPSVAGVIRMHEFTLFVGVLLLVLAYLIYFTPELPQRLATHFDSAGHVNGWSDRDTFVWLYGGMLAHHRLGSNHRPSMTTTGKRKPQPGCRAGGRNAPS